MKKHLKLILSLMLVLVTVISFSACENSSNTAVDNGPDYQDHRFYDFETGLIGNKLEYKEIQRRDPAMVGAKEGYGYIFEDNFVVDLYVYDENSEIYQSAVKSNKIPFIETGESIGVKFNGTMCIYMNNYQHEYSDDISEIFKNLK